ncbi:MAG: MFS transporter [Vulcanibacillus sp.]
MERWKKNLYILWGAGFILMAAVSSIMPFLPLHIEQNMGIESEKDISMWSGLIFGVNFFTAFLIAPLWGKIADKNGRKIMILRSGIGMALVTILMGFATNVYQLFALRFLNGLVVGFNPASIALIAMNTPKEKTGYALGLLSSGAVAGTIIGPLYGGILAEYITYNQIFIFTGILILIAALIVLFFVKEDFTPRKNISRSMSEDFKKIIYTKPLFAVFSISFLIQFAIMSINPILSLFVIELNPPGLKISFFAGLIAATTGITNVLSSPRLGKLGDRYGPEKILFYSMIGATLLFIPQGFSSNVWQLMFWRFLLGFALGGLLPSVNSIIKKFAPEGMESITYSYSSSAIFLGNLMGPIIGGILVGYIGFNGVFLIVSVLLALNSILIKKLLIDRPDRN